MKNDTRESYIKRITRAMAHIRDNLESNPGLDELSAVACFSPFHFHRVFSEMVGETLAEHVRRLKLEKAASAIAVEGSSITEAALDAGYENIESFSRAFKKVFEVNPSSVKGMKESELNSMLILARNKLRKEKNTTMDITVKKIEARRVAFVRHTGPYAGCGKAWEKLCSWAGPKGLLGPDTKFLGISYDDPDITEPSKIRYDACITVDAAVKPGDGIGIKDIRAGEFAVALHKGPLEELSNSYRYIMGRWGAESGRELKDLSIEFYLNDPGTTPPKDLLVEIQIPLE